MHCGGHPSPRIAPTASSPFFSRIVLLVIVMGVTSVTETVHGFGFVTRDMTTWHAQAQAHAQVQAQAQAQESSSVLSSADGHGHGHSSTSTSLSESLSSSRSIELSSSESSSSSSSSLRTTRKSLPPGVQVRRAQERDLKVVSNIVTDAFFGRFNPLEWLKTYLSLEDSLSDANKSEFQLYEMLVAYHVESGNIVGYCEIDCRPSSSSNPNDAPRPYMCNLAVRNKWRNRGLGSALIAICEEKVVHEWIQEVLFLRVRETNTVALKLYKNFGYKEVEMEMDNTRTAKSSKEGVLLLKKVLVSGDR